MASLGELDLGVITGDKTLKHEFVLSNTDLLKVGVVIFIAFFISTLLGNLLVRK
jgi:hypothetical protein